MKIDYQLSPDKCPSDKIANYQLIIRQHDKRNDWKYAVLVECIDYMKWFNKIKIDYNIFDVLLKGKTELDLQVFRDISKRFKADIKGSPWKKVINKMGKKVGLQLNVHPDQIWWSSEPPEDSIVGKMIRKDSS